jgi:serine/threonine protein kinase
MDPQVLHDSKYVPQSDVFSFGCVLFSLLTGLPLFPGASLDEVLLANTRSNPLLAVGLLEQGGPQGDVKLSNDCISFLRQVLYPLQQHRLTVA